MIIECPYCEAKVDGKVLVEHNSCDPEVGSPFKAVLLECPICKYALLGGADLVQVGPTTQGWTDLNRLWPQQENYFSWEIPFIARNSLVEAEKCYKAKAYDACATMAGRVLEGVCKHHSITGSNLDNRLKELKDKGIIDDRLYEWSEELRKHRNIGAHATEEKITKQDAKDLLAFVQAICDYVFVLTAKFNRFMERKDKE